MNKDDKHKYILQSPSEQASTDQFMSICRRSESLFDSLYHTYNATSIEDIHYSLMLGIKRALDALPNSSLSQEEKEQKIKYLTILQEKIVKSKDLLIFL